MKLQQNQGIKCLFIVLMITILFCGLTQTAPKIVFGEASGIIVIITSNAVWTASDSPHSLTGPLLVVQGVTLTVEAGAEVYLNGYEMRINGTLRAIGTSANKIRFIDGSINFTQYSNPWNDETGSGSILQYALLDSVSVVNSVPVSINNNPVGDDNLWTTEESPIEFTGSLTIDETEILTVEAGVSVNMKNYDLIVEGTLRVLGSSSDKVYFERGNIYFTDSSKGWNEQTQTGCVIDNAVLDFASIISNVSLKITNSNLTKTISTGDSSIIFNNIIDCLVLTGGSPVVSNNDIYSIIDCYGTPEITNNKIHLITGTGGSPKISYNTIDKLGFLKHTSQSGTENHYFVANSPMISNNVVMDGIYVNATGDATICYNNITGHSYSYDYTYGIGCFYWAEATATAITSGIVFEGTGHILGNTIAECKIGIKTGTKETIIEGNILDNNAKALEVYATAEIKKNAFRFNDVAFRTFNDASYTITDNVFDSNEVAILPHGAVTIERNLITNNQLAVLVNSPFQTIIKENSFTNNNKTIRIEDNPPDVKINYNNFESVTQNNIWLGDTKNNIDATHNWWGTADTQAINLTIHDYKYEFGLGKVNFTPFLTEPNPQAMPDENLDFSSPTIPEFSSWIILPFVVVLLGVMICKHKIEKRIFKGSHFCAAY